MKRAMPTKQAGLTWDVLRQGLAGAAVCLPLCGPWLSLCRGQLMTGFPWGAGGYAHTDSCTGHLFALGGRVWRRRRRLLSCGDGLAYCGGHVHGATNPRVAMAWHCLSWVRQVLFYPGRLKPSGTSFSDAAGAHVSALACRAIFPKTKNSFQAKA